MKKYVLYTILLAFIASFSFTGCKYDDQCDCTGEQPAAYETLTSYLVENDIVITSYSIHYTKLYDLSLYVAR